MVASHTENPVIKAIFERRSIRSFTDKAVSKEDIETIVQAGLFAPSGRNRQDWQFTIVTKSGQLAKLNDEIIKAQNRNPDYVCYYGAPVLIIVSSLASNDLSPFDCACALENIFLSAHALGLGTCWINQPGASTNDEGVRSVLSDLGVPLNHNVYGCAALGYAAGTPKSPPRRANTVIWA